jgi:hypothetical protein
MALQAPGCECEPCRVGFHRSEARVIKVRFPDLEHWKAQVKCQAGCPVRTDAGAMCS